MNQATDTYSNAEMKEVAQLCKHLSETQDRQRNLGFYSYDGRHAARPDAWCLNCQDRWDKAEGDLKKIEWFLDCGFEIHTPLQWDKVQAAHV